jgi:O-antigen biosynthesis protein
MKLSIIMPVYNNWAYTKSCLDTFANLPHSSELIVVDNGSTDETRDCSLVRIKNKENKGFGYAIGQGYEISRGDYVMFLNNDIVFKTRELDWLERYVADIVDDELVGPTGGFVDPKNNFTFLYETKDGTKPINYMSAWCLTATRKTWDKLTLPGNQGPFDSQTFFCYFEDTDASFYAKKLGMNFRIKPVPLEHIGRQTSKKMDMAMVFWESRENFLKKWK